jgi:putative transposase
VAATGIPATVTSEAAFLVDFLPVSRRMLTRTGFVIGHVHYCDALQPWIARRGRLGRFVIHRDPRDISRIWVLDPDGGTYLQVPYRTPHPPISAWEQRAAVANAARAPGRRPDPAASFRIPGRRLLTITAVAAHSHARVRARSLPSLLPCARRGP